MTTSLLPPLMPAPNCALVREGDAVPRAGMVWAIGNFDGVHLGHRAVLAHAEQLSKNKLRIDMGVGVLTFSPHPRKLFQPDMPLFQLTNAAQKARLLGAAGVDAIATIAFTRDFAALGADDFISRIVVGWLKAGGVLTGPDFRFGAKRQGDLPLLQAAGAHYGFVVETAALVDESHGSLSSTAIRHALSHGDVETANAMLGRLWSVEGVISHGQKLGRTLGFPTANMSLAPDCGLKQGIYAVFIAVDGIWHKGVASFGRRPTVDNGAPLLETFIFDFSADLYGKTVEVAFAAFLRPELKFDTLDHLIVQMKEDAAEARRLLG